MTLRMMKFTELNGENEGNVSYGFVLLSESFINVIDYYSSKEECLHDLSFDNLAKTLKKYLTPEEYGVFLDEVEWENGMYINDRWVAIEELLPSEKALT